MEYIDRSSRIDGCEIHHFLYVKHVNDSEAAMLNALGYEFMSSDGEDSDEETFVRVEKIWTPVEECLPELKKPVQVTYIDTEDGKRYSDEIAYLHKNIWWSAASGFFIEGKVIAWRECVDPYDKNRLEALQ